MPWLKLKLRVTEGHVQPLADAFEEWGAISVTFEDAADEPLFETHWDKHPLWSNVRVTGLFPEHTNADDILARAREMMNLPEPPLHEIDLLGDEDWAHSWMSHSKPLQVGRNLWVVPSWCAAPEPAAINIILDPGLAFGTGEHPTTSLCLDWLSEQTLKDKTLLDYGCGSGILSIAAHKLGATEVFAVDIDPQALEVTRQNAEHNGIHSGLSVTHPSALPKSFQADIVMANILSGTLMELAPEIKARIRPGGMLALSGLLAGQGGEVRTFYEPPFALTLRERLNWVLLTGHKSPDLG